MLCTIIYNCGNNDSICHIYLETAVMSLYIFICMLYPFYVKWTIWYNTIIVLYHTVSWYILCYFFGAIYSFWLRNTFESGQNLLISRFWKLFLKTLRQGKSKRKLWGLDRVEKSFLGHAQYFLPNDYVMWHPILSITMIYHSYITYWIYNTVK